MSSTIDCYVSSTQEEKFKLRWTIRDFSTWISFVNGDQVSAPFPANRVDVSCNLVLTPKSANDNRYLSLRVLMRTAVPGTFVIRRFEVGLYDDDNRLFISARIKSPKRGSWGWSKFLDNQYIVDQLMPHGTLTIVGFLTVNRNGIQTTHQTVPTFLSTMSKDFDSLVDCGNFGDFVISGGNGKSFRVYKGILAARSPVFADMFNDNMASDCITISDVSSDAILEFLRFIHTDTVQDVESVIRDLFVIASRYRVLSLQSLCRSRLICSLKVDTAVSLLELADSCGDAEIKRRVLDFLVQGGAVEVAKTDAWATMSRTRPQLFSQAFNAIMTELHKLQ